MQRRAAAIYFVLLVVVSAGAFAYISAAEETQRPEVDVEGTTFAEGDSDPIDGVEYTVTNITHAESEGGHGGGGEGGLVATIEWTNESAQFSAELPDNETVSGAAVRWDGQAGRYEATLEDGSELQVNDTAYVVRTNASAESLTLEHPTDENQSQSFSVGDPVEYRGNATNLTEVGESSATLVWTDDYRVDIGNESNVSTFALRQEYNVSQRLRSDDAVYNETVTINGTEYATYRANDTNVPLDEYLPEPEVREFQEGDRLQYQGNDTRVANVTAERALLSWNGSATESMELKEGSNFTAAGGGEYFVHFTGEEEVMIVPVSEYDQYSQTLAQQAYFEQRINGFWGVVIIAGIGAILLLSMAFLPVRG